jgi:hypothetical protein
MDDATAYQALEYGHLYGSQLMVQVALDIIFVTYSVFQSILNHTRLSSSNVSIGKIFLQLTTSVSRAVRFSIPQS